MPEQFSKDIFETIKIGIELGEHEEDYENFLNYINTYFNLDKLDIVVIYTRKNEVPLNLWPRWAEFFKDNKIYFAFLYTQQKGAPVGKDTHLTKEIVEQIKRIAGTYYLGDMLGETGTMICWQEGYYKDSGRKKPDYCSDLNEAKQNYIKYVQNFINLDKELGVPAILEVDQTILFRYLFEAGVNYGVAETMTCNPEVMFAALRGASRAYKREWWASHIAHEWFGGYRQDDCIKYKRLKLAFFYSYLAGAKYIYLESGHFKINSYGYTYDADSEFCEKYRLLWNEFADFVHSHPRPQNGPSVKIAFVQGNLDAWTNWESGATTWNQFGRDEYVYDSPEKGWDYLNLISRDEPWHNTKIYGDNDMSGSVPLGQYDIIPSESPIEVLQQYSSLIFLGWNTMDDELYNRLKKYVFAGGKLFMSVPQLSTTDDRKKELELIHGGDYSDLFGCIIKGRSKDLNVGIKFIEESAIANYKYPYVKDGICDPICACGKVACSDVRLTTGRIKAIMSDKFIQWGQESPPILVENNYGRGYASLITSWGYPGTAGLSKFMNVLLKSIICGENESCSIKVISNDKICYSVYSIQDGQYIIYCLNTDYNVDNNAVISYKELRGETNIKSCEMKSILVTRNLICIPSSEHVSLKDVNECGQKIKIILGSEKDEELKIFTCKRPEEIYMNGKRISFEWSGGHCVIKLGKTYKSELFISI